MIDERKVASFLRAANRPVFLEDQRRTVCRPFDGTVLVATKRKGSVSFHVSVHFADISSGDDFNDMSTVDEIVSFVESRMGKHLAKSIHEV